MTTRTRQGRIQKGTADDTKVAGKEKQNTKDKDDDDNDKPRWVQPGNPESWDEDQNYRRGIGQMWQKAFSPLWNGHYSSRMPWRGKTRMSKKSRNVHKDGFGNCQGIADRPACLSRHYSNCRRSQGFAMMSRRRQRNSRTNWLDCYRISTS